jgi:hypothetical protein
VPLPALDRTEIAGDAAAAVVRVPRGPGVGQVLGPDGRVLVTGVASSLRRWAAGHLGMGRPPLPGRRPKTNLASVAAALAWLETEGPFRQRLVYERLLAPLVPLSSRRDLKPPAFLHLDEADRFPRLALRAKEADRSRLFGPFRDRRAAERAREAVHRRFPLRPCDYAFEPHPELALGASCVFAQVRTCAAPCLARTSEAEYRALAARAAAWLAQPPARADAPDEIPPLVGRASASRALVVDAGRRTLGLYPVLGGRVLDAAAATLARGDGIDDALAALRWDGPADGPDDWPWLLSWMRPARASAAFLPVGVDEAVESLRARVRAVLPARFGDNVGPARGQR